MSVGTDKKRYAISIGQKVIKVSSTLKVKQKCPKASNPPTKGDFVSNVLEDLFTFPQKICQITACTYLHYNFFVRNNTKVPHSKTQ